MELEDFIKKTLVNIYRGIREANKEVASITGEKDGGARFVIDSMNKDSKEGYISFDVAVTVSDETKKSGGAGIRVTVVNLGGEKSSTGIQEHVSRIKFHVLPRITIA